MTDFVNRVRNDPRRAQRGPSKQVKTIWPLSDAETAKTLSNVALIRPQIVCFHSDGYTLARLGPGLIERYKSRFGTGIDYAFAIAGDFDRTSIPGFSDGWEESGRVAEHYRLAFNQVNCEVAWKTRPKGSGANALLELHASQPSVALWHTGYGAPDSVDRDLNRDGYQGFGGHHGGGLHDFTQLVDTAGRPLVSVDVPQIYWGKPGGVTRDRGPGLETQDAYCRSIASARGKGPNDEIHPDIEIGAYLQSWGCRVDELVHCSEYFAYTQWWASQYDSDAGLIAQACLAELYRLGLSTEQFQQSHGLVVDGWLGPLTYKALLPTAPWKHPQSTRVT